MSSHSSFVRKIIYLVAIAVLLMPLFWLSQPATSAVKGEQGSPGGVLSQLREKYKLSESQIGQIDPASVSMKLATLGMRGIAANILWTKAYDYKMKKEWTKLMATLHQITKIQPHFINIWSSSVAWNVSYNVSVEFDDYRQRYRWVMKGIDFLKEGIQYNQNQPRLLWDMGWTISEKIGKADESKEFRKLFKADDDFHGSRPTALRDNWLVGKEWFDRAVKMVDSGASMLGKGPLIFRSSGPMCQMSYATYLEKDGTFGEVAKRAWIDAGEDWKRYGNEEIPTSWVNDTTQEPIVIRLNDEEMREKTAKEQAAKLDAIEPGLRKKMVEERRAALSPAQREALDTPPEKRTGKQYELAMQAEQSLTVSHNEVARRIKGPKHDEAIKLAKDAVDNEQMATYIRRYREIVNFVYWRLRAKIEQTNDMIDARRLIHQGDRAYGEGDMLAARDSYQKGLAGWRKVLDKEPALIPDSTAGDDLYDVIKRYRRILAQLDEPFPKPFILQDVIDFQERNNPSTSEQKPAQKPVQKPAK
jgi:hypothetical protein